MIKDGQEILIPKSQRKGLISKLHETHLSDASMLKLARGSFFWPKMTGEIRDFYKSCLPCQENAISKKQKKTEVIPDDTFSTRGRSPH